MRYAPYQVSETDAIHAACHLPGGTAKAPRPPRCWGNAASPLAKRRLRPPEQIQILAALAPWRLLRRPRRHRLTSVRAPDNRTAGRSKGKRPEGEEPRGVSVTDLVRRSAGEGGCAGSGCERIAAGTSCVNLARAVVFGRSCARSDAGTTRSRRRTASRRPASRAA